MKNSPMKLKLQLVFNPYFITERLGEDFKFRYMRNPIIDKDEVWLVKQEML
jgi:hypothetical protein